MAYLSRIHSKGRCYLYLKEYAVRKHYSSRSIIIYRFGRLEIALSDMKKWKRNFNLFPKELKKEGFCKKDLDQWIRTLETGIHKTGRIFAINHN